MDKNFEDYIFKRILNKRHDSVFEFHCRYKMAAILQTTFLNAISTMKIFAMWFKFHTVVCFQGSNGQKTALVRIMAWCRRRSYLHQFWPNFIMLYGTLGHNRWANWYTQICPIAAMGSASQWAHDTIITSLWHQNDVATSLWRHNDVIFASCVCWRVCCCQRLGGDNTRRY